MFFNSFSKYIPGDDDDQLTSVFDNAGTSCCISDLKLFYTGTSGGKLVVVIHDRLNCGWTTTYTTISATTAVGGIACNKQGNILFVGEPAYSSNSGAIHVYTFDGSSWTLLNTFTGNASSYLGSQVRCDTAGTYIFALGSGVSTDRVNMIKFDGSTLSGIGTYTQGTSSTISFSKTTGDTAIVLTTNALNVYKRSADVWSLYYTNAGVTGNSSYGVSVSPTGNFITITQGSTLHSTATCWYDNGTAYTAMTSISYGENRQSYPCNYSSDGNKLYLFQWSSTLTGTSLFSYVTTDNVNWVLESARIGLMTPTTYTGSSGVDCQADGSLSVIGRPLNAVAAQLREVYSHFYF